MRKKYLIVLLIAILVFCTGVGCAKKITSKKENDNMSSSVDETKSTSEIFFLEVLK